MDEQDIKVGGKYLQYLSQAAQESFQRFVIEYANRLRHETENLEKSEHIGDGPPEITGAHVEDAKVITLRRMRKSSSSTIWNAIVRLVQFMAIALIGVGASNFTELWGSVICVVGILLGAIFIVIEIWKHRELY